MKNIAGPLVALSLVSISASGADISVRWSDLKLIDHEKLTVTRQDGSLTAGSLSFRSPEEIRLIPRNRPEVVIPRPGVRSISVRRDTKRWRIIGTVAGVGLGLVVGVIAAVEADGLIGSHGNHGNLVFTGVLAGSTAGGFLIGWAADRRTVTWNIQPNSTALPPSSRSAQPASLDPDRNQMISSDGPRTQVTTDK